MIRRRVILISATRVHAVVRFQMVAFLQHEFLAPVVRDNCRWTEDGLRERPVLEVYVATFIVVVATPCRQAECHVWTYPSRISVLAGFCPQCTCIQPRKGNKMSQMLGTL